MDPQYGKYLHIFERISEPIFLPKRNGTQFILPETFIPPPFQNAASLMNTEAFSLRDASFQEPSLFEVNTREIPDLSKVTVLPRGQPLSFFIPSHREAAYALVDIFMGIKNFSEMVDVAALIRDKVNEQVFVYAYSAALIRRQDARALGCTVPPIWEIFPDKFIESSVLRKAKREAKQSEFSDLTTVVVNRNFTATDRIPENRLSYFREDMGINSHHWHWHMVYPLEGTRRDRRGELFYYMHEQILARFDAERLANSLGRIVPYSNWDQPIAEGYFPKLNNSNGGLNWASRPSGMVLRDIFIVDNEQLLGLQVQVNDLERWRSRLLHAIHKGAIEIDQRGNTMVLDESTGTDILGDMIEASDWSKNKLLYGDIHNMGHTALAFIHDPDGGHQVLFTIPTKQLVSMFEISYPIDYENMCVMGDTATAMRDPIFYRWHKFIDNIFQEFKATLAPYSSEQLTFPGISINSISVTSTLNGKLYPPNSLHTGWQDSLIELDRGLDFSSQKPTMAKIRHLQHQPFTYHIYVDNKTRHHQEVCFRIFMAPVYDVDGNTFTFRDQRLLMIEMDKFVAIVPANGRRITRQSSESSVIIPFEQTFRDLERALPNTSRPLNRDTGVTQPTNIQNNACGCGWPEHFLVPRGTPAPGMPFKLFVMATDWRQDRVVNNKADKRKCSTGSAYCGVLDEFYPDKRPMGYPFDRPPERKSRLSDWLTPNMQTTDIRIIFHDETIATRE